jgi:PKD repeat protein
MKRFLLSIIILICASGLQAQSTFTNWYNDGSNAEEFDEGQATSDGGYIMVGYSGTVAGDDDGYVIKTNNQGAVQWTHRYGFSTGTRYDRVQGVQEIYGGGYIITGYAEVTATRTDGFLMRLNAAGNTVWTKNYNASSANNVFVYPTAVKQTSDYGFIVVGGGSSFTWAMKTDSSGNIQWEKNLSAIYNNPQDVIQTSDGGYLISAGNDMIKLNSSGASVWAKNYNTVASTNQYVDLRKAQEFGGSYYVVGDGYIYQSPSGVDYNMLLLKLDPATGNIRWSKFYDHDNNLGGGMEKFCDIIITSDNKLGICGYEYLASGGGAFLYGMKADTSGAVIWENVSGAIGTAVDPSEGTIRQTSNGGFILMGNCGTLGGVNDYDNIAMVKATSSGLFGGCYDNSQTDPGILTTLIVTSETNSLTTGMIAYTGNAPLISSSITAGVFCAPANLLTADFSGTPLAINTGQSVNFTDLSTGGPTSWSWTFTGGTPSTSSAQNPSTIVYNTAGCYAVTLTVTNATTNDTKTVTCYVNVTTAPPPPPPAGAPFTNWYNDGSNAEEFDEGQATSDGGYIMVGYAGTIAGDDDGYIIKTDSAGMVQWTHRYGFSTGSSYDRVQGIQQVYGGGYIITGYTQVSSTRTDGFIMRLNAAGTTVWTKNYNSNSPSGVFVFPTAIKQTSDYGFILVGGGYNFTWAMKTDSSGNIQWEKELSAIYNNPQDVIQTSDGGYLISANNDMIKLNSSGASVWAKNYNTVASTNQYVDLRKAQEFGGSYYVVGDGYIYQSPSGVDYNMLLVKLDPATGNIRWSKFYDHDNNLGGGMEKFCDIIITNDHKLGICGYEYLASGGGAFLYGMKADTSGAVIWEHVSGAIGTAVDPSEGTIRQTADGGFCMMGNCGTLGGVNDYDNIAMVKTISNGSFNSCIDNPQTDPGILTTLLVTNETNTLSSVMVAYTGNAPLITSGIIGQNYCTGVAPLEAGNFAGIPEDASVFPNPNNGIFTMKANDMLRNATVDVYNLTGQLVRSENMGGEVSKDFNFEELPEGLYFVKIESNGIKQTLKIVIAK